MKKRVNKLILVGCSALFFIFGWKVSCWYYNNFDYWLDGPPPAEYLGINMMEKTFDFQLSYTGGVTRRPFSSLGADRETAHQLMLFCREINITFVPLQQ